jgi:hypothetical protein
MNPAVAFSWLIKTTTVLFMLVGWRGEIQQRCGLVERFVISYTIHSRKVENNSSKISNLWQSLAKSAQICWSCLTGVTNFMNSATAICRANDPNYSQIQTKFLLLSLVCFLKSLKNTCLMLDILPLLPVFLCG